ncbi:MAG: 30S ribosomal protein S17e [Hadesarchaea archaeon]|nr:30S ribosomal protein S17e [Hadesarchaea archaeon]
MGRVRQTFIKRAAEQLLQRYPELFSMDFNQNRQALEKLVNIPSKPLKNKVAGYITALVKQKSRGG